MAFFNNNRVVNYTLEKSIGDGVNVPERIYRIKTKAEEGGAIREGDKFHRVARYTGKIEDVRSKEVEIYTAKELNRSIINPAQIKLVLETYRDAVFEDMFTDPQREKNFDYLPKTLIFALNDAHATNIVNIAKEKCLATISAVILTNSFKRLPIRQVTATPLSALSAMTRISE